MPLVEAFFLRMESVEFLSAESSGKVGAAFVVTIRSWALEPPAPMASRSPRP